MKKYFPISFKNPTDLIGMIVAIIIYAVIGIIAGALIWVAGLLGGWIPGVGVILGWVLRIVSIIVDVYVVAGIVISVLAFLGIVK